MITRDPKHILLADDSVFFKIKLSTILMAAGHKVTLTGDGQEVLDKLREGDEKFDLLVLDLHMPRIDGFEVMGWMNENGYAGRPPTVTVTGVYEPVAIIERLRELGSKGLIIKGFTPEQVVYTVNSVLHAGEPVNNRQKDRVPVAAPVELSIEGHTYKAFLLNISSTGIFVHTKKELPPGTAIGCKFSLPGSKRIFDLRGNVLWATPPEAAKDLFVGAGLTFLSISSEDRRTIEEFVEEELKRLPVYF